MGIPEGGFEEDEYDEKKPPPIPSAEVFDLDMDLEPESGEKQETDAEDAEPVEKKRKMPVLVLLGGLMIFGAAGYGLYTMGTDTFLDTVKGMVAKIPYLDLEKEPEPEVQNVGEIIAIESSIKNKFVVNNPKAGTLLVITGKIKNEYSNARNFIKMRGILYTKNKTLAKQETFYCGNILSDKDLSNLDPEAIKKRLSNRSGDNGSNEKVNPGKTLPFMMVFSNLPDNLDEFTVEVAGSDPSQG